MTVNWNLLGYLILQYLNGICNVPSGLPFVDLDTCSTEFSATFVVLTEFSATHASSSHFIPKIRVIYIINWNLSKWSQCGNAWRRIFTHSSGSWRSPRRFPHCSDLDTFDLRSWSSSRCCHDLRRKIWIGPDQTGFEDDPDLYHRRCHCRGSAPYTDCSPAIWPSRSPRRRWPLLQRKVYKIHGNSPFLSVASTTICLIPYRHNPIYKLDIMTEEVEEMKNSSIS